MRKPRLLDLCCGDGGASMGYALAGFEVVGVDKDPHPLYPFKFHQADALTYPLDGFDAYHASPPCKADNQAALCRPEDQRRKYPRLIAPIRERLLPMEKPFVIENVPLARRQLQNPIMLCGTMFGLKLRRHRYFELHGFEILLAPATCGCRGKAGWTASTHGSNHISSFANGAKLISVAGHNFAVEDARIAMGMDWSGQAGLSQAIPPAYTEYIGRWMMTAIVSHLTFSSPIG